MDENEVESLVQAAIAGDQGSLQVLLHLYYDDLAAWLTPRVPGALQSIVGPDDVVQEACERAFRGIQKFMPQGPGSFRRWLFTLCEHALQDQIKSLRRRKRGGQALRVSLGADQSTSMMLALLGVDSKTPSRVVGGREAIRAMQVAMAGLPDEYRLVLQLRYMQGLSVAEVAARMGRNEGAVAMLCHRALRQMRTLMGRSTDFFSRKG